MTLYVDLVNEISLNISGYTAKQDRTTHLTAGVNSSATSFSLGNVTNIGKGIIEIDDELIWLDSYDRISSTATAAPYGRGYQGSTAASHSQYARVTIAPTFPRISIRRAISDTINAVYPRLWGVGTHTFTLQAARTTYSIPADAETVLYVSWQTTGPSQEWMRAKNWRLDRMANTTAYPTGNTISIYDRITPGRTVQVIYSKKPVVLVNDADVFTTVTGLQSSSKDVIVLGASYRLMSFIDPGRANYTSAEADLADSKIQYGSAAATARYFRTLYQERLNEEAGKLREYYPINNHYTRY